MTEQPFSTRIRTTLLTVIDTSVNLACIGFTAWVLVKGVAKGKEWIER